MKGFGEILNHHRRGYWEESDSGMSNQWVTNEFGAACSCGKLAEDCEAQTFIVILKAQSRLISAQDRALDTVKLMVARVPDGADFTIRYEHPILATLKQQTNTAETVYYSWQQTLEQLA